RRGQRVPNLNWRRTKRTETGLNKPCSDGMDWKLELVMVPVTDVDRAKAFYTDKIGFNADHDARVNENLRFVQLTPPGSACSIAIGEGIAQSAPGSAHLQIVVAEAQAAHDQLAQRGVEVSEVQNL